MLGSLISGGLTGILGAVVSNVTDIFKDRQKQAHERENRKLDLEAMDKEYSFEMSRTAAENQSKLDAAEIGLIAMSYEHDAASYSKGMKIKSGFLQGLLVFVDVIRGLVRPVLTAFLIWCIWDTRLEVKAIIEAAGIATIPIEQAISIYAAVVDAIIYIGTTACLWWFGTRPKKDKKGV